MTGTYYVVLPDGRKQRVDYKVDAYSGYVAEVKYEGVAYHPVAASYSPPAVPVALYVNEVTEAPAAEPVAPVEAQTVPYGTKIVAAEEKETEPSAEPAAPAEAAPAEAEAAPVEVITEASAKAEWIETAATEAAPATEAALAETPTEVPTAEVVPEKTEWTEPAKAEATKGAKRSYQRSKMATAVSNEQRYYASRVIRKRQPTATSVH